ncbi:MAG: cell division ATP-binding protein FtsE [Bdellovibrionales bacterium]|nr:cell division ATP-binding protein FtsE [Bdellovibrionales bacterium]
MVKLSHVYKTYSPDIHVLKNVELNIKPGEFVFVVGPSGAGKTTLFRLITGFDTPTSGSIEINGFAVNTLNKTQIAKFRQSIGVVFQDFKLLNDRNVFENVSLPLRIQGKHKFEIIEHTDQILKKVGLSKKAKEYPVYLSGGEKQRVAIARALVHQPKLLIADEPTGNLDWKLSDEIMNLFSEINNRGTTVFIATHDQNLIKNTVKKKIINIEAGQVFQSGDKHPCGQYFKPLNEAGLNIL